jgi:hypothetical protein
MRNMGNMNMNTMNDINGMLNNSDLRVIKENYQYILWSIVAVGAVAVTIKLMK